MKIPAHVGLWKTDADWAPARLQSPSVSGRLAGGGGTDDSFARLLEVYLVSQLDLGNSHGDFPGHKNLSTTRGLVIEQYAVAAEHAVGLPAPSTPYSIAAHVQ